MKHFILFYYHLFINTESQDIKHVCGHIARRLNEVEVDKRRWGDMITRSAYEFKPEVSGTIVKQNKRKKKWD